MIRFVHASVIIAFGFILSRYVNMEPVLLLVYRLL